MVVGEYSATDELWAGVTFALVSDESNHRGLILKEAILMYEGFIIIHCFLT